ncbi:S8 family serine peptidase [Micromonospora sp. NPDC005806]|uniref:S8 family peptidase n=1 Tax=Micromonospora sp. NPDC005806 TaxID=3364234 RepID=UPI003696C51F
MTVTPNDDLRRVIAASGGSVPVTLITGDKVYVGINADGKPVARDFESAARPDGSSVVFQTITRKGNVYVVPNDALSLLGNGLLDWGLFDLTQLVTLVAAGKVGEVPVLVTYTENAAVQRVPKVAGASVGRELPSINGRSMDIADGGRWWQEVRGKRDSGSAARSAGSLAGVKKVWLDELAKASLDSSVPQIGANVAWDRGYDGAGVSVAVLDTGIDPNHPDVAGNLVEQVDFTGNPRGARDGHGHGTHVAATILGTGAASNGLRKGVAPGAKLRVGKVLDDGGSGSNSSIIAGMEWAAHSGAKVVNMSLGGGATDGTDPLSQSLNQLSRTTGALFVVAAGNSGPQSGTVGTPGAADEALTVAAVDKQDKMADFSSRGPRVGDGAAKPDIAAPGVAIVAARAAGTAMGKVVDEHYTSASGTSMATPHVAGAAALIAQQHPNLTGHEIKALLMSTATDLGHDTFAQGAGRVNLATAVDPTVTTNGNLFFGRLAYPHAPLTKKVTYTNHTDEAITLKLTTSISHGEKPAPAGLVTLGADEVVVPANASAEVPVTLDGRALGTDGPFGDYHGRLNARDSSGVLRATSSVSTFLEPQKFPVTVNVIRPPGASDFRYDESLFLPVDDNALHEGPVGPVAGGVTVSLVPGTYSVSGKVGWVDEVGEWNNVLPVAPEVSVTKATTVTFDLRKLKPLKVQAPEPTENYNSRHVINRVSATGAWGMTTHLASGYSATKWWAIPTAKVRTGTLTHELHSVLTTPVVTMQAVGGGAPFRLSPRYHTPDASAGFGEHKWQENGKTVRGQVRFSIPRLPIKGHVPVVYAGTGSAAEFANVDARGKLVLLTPTDICSGSYVCEFQKLRDERVAAAHAAGAAGVMVAVPGLVSLGSPSAGITACTGGLESCPAVKPYAALPIVQVPYGEADRLIKRIKAAPSEVEIILGGSATPTVYAARYASDGQIPSDLPYQPKKEDFDRVDHYFHADRPQQVTNLTWEQHSESGPTTVSLNLPRITMQQTLTTFVKRQDDTIDRFSTDWADYAQASVLVRASGERQDVVLGSRNQLHWNQGPTVPGAVPQVRTKSGFTLATGTPCVGCRQGNTFHPNFFLTGSGGARQAAVGVVTDWSFAEVLFGAPPCMSPACNFRLFNQSGDEVERRTEWLVFRPTGKSDITPDLSPGSPR